jgi:uncharacterized repeat protein (TIGR03803 family)
VLGTDGKLYGTTALGGGNSACGNEGCGTVFSITPAGTLTTLHRFDQTDGAEPVTALIQAADGDSMGQRRTAGSTTLVNTAVARSSKSRQQVR